jgi:phage shock protein C
MVAGVAGGLAEHLDADPSLIRIVWALLVFLTGGLALVVYIVMAIVVPEGRAEAAAPSPGDTDRPGSGGDSTDASSDPADGTARIASDPPTASPSSPSRPTRRDRHRSGQGGLIFGLLLILLGGYFLVRQFIPTIDLGAWWPVILIGLGFLLVVIAVLPGRRSS